MPSPRTFAAIAAGLSLAIPAHIGLGTLGGPTALSPFPVLTLAPTLLLLSVSSFLSQAAMFVPVILFYCWNPGLLKGRESIPIRTYWMFGALAALSLVHFAVNWRLGVKYDGIEYTRAVCFANAAWFSVLLGGFGWAWNRQSAFWTNLLLHWALFVWLAWYAFPYLGELP